MKFSLSLIALIGATNASNFFQTPLVATEDFKVPGDNTLSYCADPADYILSLDYLHLTPNPPIPGENLTINAGGQLSEVVDEGSKVHVSVKWNFVTLINKDYNLCDNAQIVGKECPLTKGVINITKEIEIPKEVPKGKFVVNADAFTKDEDKGGKRVTCLKGDITF